MSKPKRRDDHSVGAPPPAAPDLPLPAHKPIPMHWQAAVVLALVVACCYANSLRNSFHYDDIHSILENDSVRTLKPQHVWAANSRARFVSMYSFSLNYALHGFATLWPWHAVNIAAHLLCGVLVYALVLKTRFGRKNRVVALLAAALFLVHPLCTEPVNYIQARSAQFVLLFPLATAFFLLEFMERRAAWALSLGVICAGLGCLSKEVGAFYVVAIPLLFWLAAREPRPSKLPAARPRLWLWLALALVGLGVMVLLGQFTGIIGSLRERLGMASYSKYILSECAFLFSYMRLMVLPWGLSADHYEMLPAQVSLATYLGVAAYVALISFTVWLWRRAPAAHSTTLRAALREVERAAGFALGWVLVMHLPYQLIPGPELMVEYRAYPMMVGFAVGMAALILWLIHRPKLRLAVAGAVVLVLGAATVHRNADWKDGVALWSGCLASGGKDNPRAHNNLGTAYLQQGKLDLSRREFERALTLAPGVAEVHYNLGVLDTHEKHYAEAVLALKKAVQLKPDFARAHNALGTANALAGKYDLALLNFREAIRLNPTYIQARNGLGNAYSGKGMYEAAIAEYQAVLDWGIQSSEVYRNLGDAWRGKGDLETAIVCYRKSIALNPREAAGYNNLGNALKDQRKTEDAIAAYQKAVEADPDYAMAWNNLGSAYLLLRRYAEAEQNLRKAIEKDPKYASAQGNLGSLLHMKGDDAGAEACYREAVHLDPNYADGWYNLGAVLRKQKREQEAQEAFQRAARLRTNRATAN